MGTIIDLTIAHISIDDAKNHMGIDHGVLFQASDAARRRPVDATDDENETLSDEERANEEAAFARPLGRVLPRLDLLGHTLDAARSEYNELVRQNIADAGSEEEDGPPPSFMSFDEYCGFCTRYPLAELSHAPVEDHEGFRFPPQPTGRFVEHADEIARIPRADDAQHLFWSEASYFGNCLCVLSPYAMLQVLGSSPANHDAELMWLFGPLCENGWEKASAFYAGARRDQTILVATEGTSDSRIIQRALDLYQPDIADFFRFIDVNESHPFWGTGNLVRFAEGLVRIDVQNKVLFLLDNDAEGVDADRRLRQLGMPPNMRSLRLPDLPAFADMAARGPDGIAHCDINGRAAAIECYLDLALPGYPPAQVVWTNYKKELGIWQGALEHKESYARHFFAQDADTLRTGAYDSAKLRQILTTLLSEATRLVTGIETGAL